MLMWVHVSSIDDRRLLSMFLALPSVLFQKALELTPMASRRPQTLTDNHE